MEDYWEKFYSNTELTKEIRLPSLFAQFVVQHVDKSDLIVDIGCGNGRDLLFFSTEITNLIGVDKSKAALDSIDLKFADSSNLSLMKVDLGVDDDITELRGLINNRLKTSNPKLHFYCRFLVHSINDNEFNSLLKLVSSFSDWDPTVYFEYREFNEGEMTFHYPPHTRFFRRTEDIVQILAGYGLTLSHNSTSFDYSPLQNEKPLLTRLIAEVS